MSESMVLALPGAEALAADLAGALGCERGQVEFHLFPDGEQLVRIAADVKGRRVVLASSLEHPAGKVLPLVFAADALRELGAVRVSLAAPYLPFMRQDRRFRPGEAVSSRSFARLLSRAVDGLVTVDPHLHRWNSLNQIFSIPSRCVAAAEAIAAWIRSNIPSPLIVGPDGESAQWVKDVAGRLDAPFIVLRKARHGDDRVDVELAQPPPAADMTPVLLDDILSTGGTLAAATRVLLAAGTLPPVCAVVHDLHHPQASARLHGAGVARVVSCNTVPGPSNAIDVRPWIAGALQELDGAA